MCANMRAYAQMVDEAEKSGCPKNYATDLYVVDRAYMEWDAAPRTFGWILRESGTHLIMSANDKATIEYWVNSQGSSEEMFYLYWYDGDWLRTIGRSLMLTKTSRLPSFEMKKKAKVHDGVGNPNYIWLHNRIEQLHIQEEARRGRVYDHIDLVVRSPYSQERAIHVTHRFDYIDSLNHWSEALKAR